MTPLRSLQSAVQSFLRLESAGGIMLVLAALRATALTNSPVSHVYDAFLKILVGYTLLRFLVPRSQPVA